MADEERCGLYVGVVDNCLETLYFNPEAKVSGAVFGFKIPFGDWKKMNDALHGLAEKLVQFNPILLENEIAPAPTRNHKPLNSFYWVNLCFLFRDACDLAVRNLGPEQSYWFAAA